jgi:hypothetical protein
MAPSKLTLTCVVALCALACPAGARSSARALRRYGAGLTLSGDPGPRSAPLPGDSAAAPLPPDGAAPAAPGGAGSSEPAAAEEGEVTWDVDADEAAAMSANSHRPPMPLQLAKLITLQWCAFVAGARAAVAAPTLAAACSAPPRPCLPFPPAAVSKWAR